MENEFRDIENTSRLEIAIGISLKVGDEIHFFEDPLRTKILQAFLKPLNAKNEKLWIESRSHIEWGRLEAIGYEQRYHIGPEIQVKGMWFPLALMELNNGEPVNWPAFEDKE